MSCANTDEGLIHCEPNVWSYLRPRIARLPLLDPLWCLKGSFETSQLRAGDSDFRRKLSNRKHHGFIGRIYNHARQCPSRKILVKTIAKAVDESNRRAGLMVLEPIGRLFWRRTSSFCFVPQPSAFLVGALLYPLVRVIVSQHKVFRAL